MQNDFIIPRERLLKLCREKLRDCKDFHKYMSGALDRTLNGECSEEDFIRYIRCERENYKLALGNVAAMLRLIERFDPLTEDATYEALNEKLSDLASEELPTKNRRNKM